MIQCSNLDKTIYQALSAINYEAYKQTLTLCQYCFFVRQAGNEQDKPKYKRDDYRLTAKLLNWNFHQLEVASRWCDPQFQVSENYSHLTK